VSGPPPPEIVVVPCPWCRREALHVTDGPALEIKQPLSGEEAIRTGDVCGFCPSCGRLVCVRILRSAA